MTKFMCYVRHSWRWMTAKEAYPAPGGRICNRCGATRLYW